MKLIQAVIFSLLISVTTTAQDSFPYRVSLEPVIPAGFSGLQSFAWAKSGNRVLLVGGRTDGLHRRQPFASFAKRYNNTSLIVIDLDEEKSWKKSIASLPAPLAEQLQSTNMEFYQEGNQLILTGGYGYSETKKDHITYPSLVLIRVDELVEAIISDGDVAPYIYQLNDERMAVTGGRLSKLGDRYYLVGGQRFDGRYNPHGPDHGPGFSQQYTNQVRKFALALNGEKPEITRYETITDSLLLHRRDYNLLAQVDGSGKPMLTIYSGVFRYGKDVPFTTLVDITENSHAEVKGFNQQFAHYHTATLPVFSQKANTLYSVFFGGIAQQYPDSAGKIITDNDIPFVKTISVVERKGGVIKEYVLPEPMPGYFGAAAEFIPADTKNYSSTGILQAERIGKKPFLAGYIVGGIDSRARNVFWSNEAEPSRASPVIWKVLLTRK